MPVAPGLVAREQRHGGQMVIGRQRSRSRVGQASSSAGTCGAAGQNLKRTLKAGTGFRRSVSSFLFLFFFLPLPSTHNTETLCVFLASETTDQHFLSSRSPALRIRVQNPPKPATFRPPQAVYVFVPPLSTTRSSGPSQAAALSYIAKTL